MKQKILIIEDELLIAKDISIILEKEGYETRMGITSTEEALEELNNNTYDLVLIDVNLSNKSSGIDIGNFLLNKDCTPYMYITSYSDNITVENIKETRPYGIIIKPFKPVDIITNVSIVLNNNKHKKIDVLRKPEITVYEVPFILKNVIEYINNNLHKKLEINEIAALSKWSHQHFIKIFTQFIGKTPYQYILQKKIEKAKAIITETEIPLNSVAVDLGFESYSNFFNAFKRETGYSPDFYRKMYKINKYLNK